ncbi:MAG: hypothetical protein ACK4OM_01855 [Alphaproteobacteria bacterium]
MAKTTANKNNFKLISVIIRCFCVIVALSVLIISRYAFIFFVFAMLPAITSVTIDRRMDKYASSTVCAFNLMGVFPFLFNLLKSNVINNTAQVMLSTPFVWFTIYGCTSLGWLLIWGLPRFTSKIFLGRTKYKIEAIIREQNDLMDEWGVQVQGKNF